MRFEITSDEYWRTREGQHIAIKSMASAHLLATIHMIERGRFTRTSESAFNGAEINELEIYLNWPAAYPNLVREAQKRNLIYRVDVEKEAPPRKKLKGK